MSQIIDRIRKLLALAGNAGSEAEATLAASRAAEMMAKHEIHEAELSLGSPNEPRTPEPIDSRHQATSTTKKVAWHMAVLGGVARSYGAHTYWSRGKVMLFGRLTAVQSATYTGQYLMRAIEQIADEEAPSSAFGRAYRNAFRLGAARRIAARLDERTALTRQGGVDAKSGAHAARLDVDEEAGPIEAPPASAGVIAVIQRDRAEVDQAWKNYERGFGRASSVGNYSSAGGFAAGRAAGGRVSLGGNARGGLKAGQGSLK